MQEESSLTDENVVELRRLRRQGIYHVELEKLRAENGRLRNELRQAQLDKRDSIELVEIALRILGRR